MLDDEGRRARAKLMRKPHTPRHEREGNIRVLLLQGRSTDWLIGCRTLTDVREVGGSDVQPHSMRAFLRTPPSSYHPVVEHLHQYQFEYSFTALEQRLKVAIFETKIRSK